MRILWLTDLDKDVMWNQNFYHERAAFMVAHDVMPWGQGWPGFNPHKTAPALDAEHGPFDLVVCSEFFLYTQHLMRVDELPCPKAAILCDPYVNGIPSQNRRWKQNGVSIVLHRYVNFLDEWREKTPSQITFYHQPWAADTEVYDRPLVARSFDVGILGNTSSHLYPIRHKVKELLLDSILRVNWRPHPGGVRYGMNYEQPTGSVIGTAYADLLAQSRISIATGGKPEFMVGKYFTIPSTGSLLLATKVPNMTEQGFVPDENMVLLDERRPIEQITALLSNWPHTQRIADAGYDLIRERHTWGHRVAAFTEWFDA